MRVLIVGHSYINQFGQEKLEAIARTGIALALLAPNNWRHLGGLFDGQPCPIEKPFDSFRVYGGPVIRPGHAASFLYAPGVVRRVLRDFRPDLVQIEQEVYSFAAAQASLAAKAAGKKVVVFSWENLDRRIHLLQRLARWITVRKSDGILSGNQAGEVLLRKWGFHGRTAVIPQIGVDTASFAPRPRGTPVRLTVGYVGRLVPEKGIGTLLSAVAILARQGIDCEVVICGSGPQGEALARTAADLGIAPRITWKGSVPHAAVPEVMAGMDVLVLPSMQIPNWAEQFGLVLAQAMAMGIPVLGSDSGAIPEVIGRRDALFPEGDAAALAALLAAVLSSPVLRGELRDHGVSRVRAHYSQERITERTIEFWRELTESAPKLA